MNERHFPRLALPLDQCTVADVCLESLTKRVREEVDAIGSSEPWSRDVNIVCLAILLLCHKHRDSITDHGRSQLLSLHDLVSEERHHVYSWVDVLPFALALEALEPPEEHRTIALAALTSRLTYAGSDIRTYLFYLGWFCRNRLRSGLAVVSLLENTANTIGGWHLSFGLCAALFEDLDEFWQQVDDFAPEEFGTQYVERVADMKQSGLGAFWYPFLTLESSAYAILSEVALNLPIDQPGEHG